jgi:tRNA 2-thiocytidine biosynthesis protein TtcA
MSAQWIDNEVVPLQKELKIERETHKLEKRLCRQVGQAIMEYNMIEAGDKVMVCVSGGKDSYAMLDILLKLKARAPVHFDLVAVNLDQGQPGFPAHVVEEHLRKVGVPYRMLRRDTYSVVKRVVPEGKSTCAACSRFRRGVLYDAAVELGCSKIALGHHREDLIETLLLNALYSGSLKAMPPKLHSSDGRNVVIRPLCYAAEADIAAFAAAVAFPIVPCDLCGSQPNLRRKRVKGLLAELSAEHPAVKGNLLHALGHVIPGHLLDRDLQRALATSTGKDPWLEAEDEEACSPEELLSLVPPSLKDQRGTP